MILKKSWPGVVNGLWFVLLLLSGSIAHAAPARSAVVPVNAVFLADVHLDPFADPSKVARLQAAPVDQWDAILSEPDAPDAAARTVEVGKTCGNRGQDSPYALMASTLAATKAQSAGARFVMVGGDMLVHNLDCRYKLILNTTDMVAAAEFAARTANFVMASIEKTFPGLPVYNTLGNNDVGCGNTRLDVRDPFLAGTVDHVLHGLHGSTPAELKQARADYLEAGYYTVMMRGPMRGTRLVVLDDTYLLLKHYDCTGAKEFKGGEVQLAWLEKQLARSKRRGEKVWLLGHASPGVNTYDAFAKMKNMCTEATLSLFLRDDSMAEVMRRYPKQIRFSLFAHSHMDELRLVQGARGSVPVKVLPSISPVNGNMPTFTLAKVNPRTATVLDYTVYTGSNFTGIATEWTRTYSFDETYRVPDFSARSLDRLIGRLQVDRSGTTPEGLAMKRLYSPGPGVSLVESIWPAYACTLNHDDEAGFKACYCKDAGTP